MDEVILNDTKMPKQVHHHSQGGRKACSIGLNTPSEADTYAMSQQ